MTDEFATPREVLAYLVHALDAQTLWTWLGETGREELLRRVILGFRPTAKSLQQPAAQSRITSHLEKNADDFQSLLTLWGATEPRVLSEIRAHNEGALTEHLPALQQEHGIEPLHLALLYENNAAVLNTLHEIVDVTPKAHEDPHTSTECELTRQIATLQAQLAKEQATTEHWREKYKTTQAQAAINEKGHRDKLAVQEKIAQNVARERKAESLRAVQTEEKLQKSEKARERAERRSRSTQLACDSALQEVKTLKKQLHRLQQINEELRDSLLLLQENLKHKSTAATTEAKQELTPQTLSPTATIPTRTKVHAPTDVQRIHTAIDRNDETFVAKLRSDLKSLRVHDNTAYKRLIKELRTGGEYYTRILLQPTARLLVDASNVARYDATKKGRMRYLTAMKDELRRHDFFPILFVADASLPYFIDEPQQLRALIQTGGVLVTESGQQADEVLAHQSRQTGAYVVTNDRNFHYAFAPDFVPQRIGFRIIDGIVILEDEY